MGFKLRRMENIKNIIFDLGGVIMDIDVQGAMQFRSAFPESVLVYVLPPSGEVLLHRLRASWLKKTASTSLPLPALAKAVV